MFDYSGRQPVSERNDLHQTGCSTSSASVPRHLVQLGKRMPHRPGSGPQPCGNRPVINIEIDVHRHRAAFLQIGRIGIRVAGRWKSTLSRYHSAIGPELDPGAHSHVDDGASVNSRVHPNDGNNRSCSTPNRSGYLTCTRYSPAAGDVMPPRVRSRASSTLRTHPSGSSPRPTASSVPAILRTM